MRGVIFSVAGRDVVFRGSKEDFAEGFFTNGAGGRRWEGGEEGLGFLCEGGPVSKGKIGVGFEFILVKEYTFIIYTMIYIPGICVSSRPSGSCFFSLTSKSTSSS